MRVAASTSSPLVSPTSGFRTAPVKWPARVSRSRPTTRAYSWARCSGLRVWKATTRRKPLSRNRARVCRGVRTTSPYSGCGSGGTPRTSPPTRGVRRAPAADRPLVGHAVPLGLGHRAGERAEAAVADAVERRQVGLADGDAGQALGLAEHVGRPVGGEVAVDRLGEAAVRRDQVSH